MDKKGETSGVSYNADYISYAINPSSINPSINHVYLACYHIYIIACLSSNFWLVVVSSLFHKKMVIMFCSSYIFVSCMQNIQDDKKFHL
mgnify:CR=1 FL=1